MTALAVAPTIIQRAYSIPREVREWTPKSRLGKSILRAIPHLPADLAAELIERIQSTCVIESSLSIVVFRGYEGLPWYALTDRERRIEHYGVVGRKVVTTAGVNKIVAALNTSDASTATTFKYHSLGTGSTAEASSDTALVTELTTEYNPDSTRATGTQTTSGGSNIYSTVATNTLDGTPGAALREHGVHSASSAGTLLDRTVYTAINLSSGDGLQSTYNCTFSAGG